MKTGQGVMIALVSLILLIGTLSLSLAEGKIASSPASTSTPTSLPTLSPSATLPVFTASPTRPASLTPTGSPTLAPVSPLLPSLTPSLLPSLTPFPTSFPTWTPTFPQPTVYCAPPVGWVPYIVQPTDTLTTLAAYYRTSSLAIQQGNCLVGSGVVPGALIYVPLIPTQTSITCGPPYNWIVRIVQPGDTLYHLSQIYAVSVYDLQRANCMGSSTLLQAGKNLYIPPWAPLDPAPTFPFLATGMPTNTLVPSPSEPSIIIPTLTPSPTPN